MISRLIKTFKRKTENYLYESLNHSHMKELRITLEDSDYKKLAQEKKIRGLSWRNFLLTLIK